MAEDGKPGSLHLTSGLARLLASGRLCCLLLPAAVAGVTPDIAVDSLQTHARVLYATEHHEMA